MTRWNLDYLDEVCGDETVQVMAGRDGDPGYEIHSDHRRTTMRFGDYVKRIKNAGQTNDFYLVAQNEFMRTASAKRLYDDINFFPDYLDNRRDGFVFFWFGPGGTVTPLHHDTADIILAQVQGRKRVTMIPAVQKALSTTASAFSARSIASSRTLSAIRFIVTPTNSSSTLIPARRCSSRWAGGITFERWMYR